MKMRINAIVIIALVLFFSSFINKTFAQLKPETVRQISLLLEEKEARTAAQYKIQSQLLRVIKEFHSKQITNGLKLRPVIAKIDSKGYISVDISATVTTELLNKIEALGGIIIYPSKEYNTIRAKVNLAMIDSISGFPEVTFIRKAIKARTIGSGVYKKTVVTPSEIIAVNPVSAQRVEKMRHIIEKYMENYSGALNGTNGLNSSTGSVVSEGDRTHRADDARKVFGYTGKGIRIGVISDSYNAHSGAAIDVINGDLPGIGNPYGHLTPVTVVQDDLTFAGTDSGASDEGRAMLQIVHDLAPDAQLFFATGNISEASFANNIKALRNAPNNCDIIIDDLGYFDEPVFQDGIIAKAVNTVTAGGALYFSSAGNDGSLLKGTSGVFEGDFNSTGSPVFTPAENTKTGAIHNFGTTASPINGDIITGPIVGNLYTLNWADAIGASANDYDLFLIDIDGNVIDYSTDRQNGTQDPYEEIAPYDLIDGDRLVVFKTSAAAKRAFDINTHGGTLTKATTGQTYGHPCAVAAFGVAATPAAAADGGVGDPAGPFPAAFSTGNHVESFSSDGPRRIFYTPTGTAITAGNFLFATNGGSVLNKPDITAADGVATNVTGTTEFNSFFGTSAAAPHAGAIAALIKSGNPSLTPAQIRAILTGTALDIESVGYDINSGYGIVQAFQAMQSVSPVPLSNIDIDTVSITEGEASNNNGAIDPGETGNLLVRLIDPSLVTDSNVISSIKTTTPGVTVIQGIANYGNLAPSGNAGRNFTFSVSPSVPCGTIINFFDTVKFGGGGASPQIFMFTINVGSQPDASISSTLGSTPPTSVNFTSLTGFQTGRINRETDGSVSSCSALLPNPGAASATGKRAYDAYKFTNKSTASQCITVILNSTNADSIFCVTYNDSGYLPATPATHFLADGGNSYSPEQYSFTAPAGKSFTVVIHAVDPAKATGSLYNLNVSLSQCTIIYTFTGNGNWNVPSNWLGGLVPPSPLPSGYEIFVDPAISGECVLNVQQVISAGGIINVQPGKKMRILNNLSIQ